MLLEHCYCPYIRTILKYVHHFANIAIQKKDLENFTIFVPNLLIQRKNLALFEMLDEKICILNEELERLEKQKKYLLRNLFI